MRLNWSKVLELIVHTSLIFWTASPVWADDRVKVIVSVIPQKYFVEKIGGDYVDVSPMVSPGSSPHVYEPKPQQMVDLTRAKLYFAVGVPFEKVWLKKLAHANPEMVIIHTEDGIEKLPMDTRDHHKKADLHNHENTDPHIWLSPPLVMIQARHILYGLLQTDPGNDDAYRANYRAFIKELVNLDLRLLEIFEEKGDAGNRFMVFHPSWGYFALAYGLEQIAIEMGGKEPSAKELLRIVQQARHDNIKVMFVQPQISVKSAETIAKAINCRVLTADPLAADWEKNLLKVAVRFKGVLR